MDIRVGGYNYFFTLLTLLSVPLVSIKMLLVVKLFYFLKCEKQHIENERECFWVSRHQETDESTEALCFYCFKVSGYPDEV